MALASDTAEFIHDLTLKILPRLPVKSLTRFKCVCKQWNFIVSDPKFVRAYLKTMAAIGSHHHFILYDFVRGAFYTRITSNIRHGDQQQEIEATELQHYSFDLRLSRNPTKFILLIGHCDCMLCIATQSAKAWLHTIMLWNPSIRELKQIPAPTSWNTSSWRVLGFGFDFSTDDYKLVRVPTKYSDDHSGLSEYSDIEVLSLKNNSIRMAEQGIPYFAKSRQKATFAHGCLYWFACKPSHSGINHDLILCFDLAKEKVREVSPPPCSEDIDSSSLCLFHGYLSVLRHNKIIDDLDVWIMKEKSKHKSWMKLIRLPQIPNSGRIWRPFPLCYIREDRVLVSADNRNLFLFNPKDESYEKLVVNGTKYWARVIPYVESLVSPYRISKAGVDSILQDPKFS